MSQKIHPNQRTLLELVEGKETDAADSDSRQSRPTSLPTPLASSLSSSSKKDESSASATVETSSSGLSTSPPTSLASLNMEHFGKPKEVEHYPPSIRRNASAPINLSSSTNTTGVSAVLNADSLSLTSKNSESSDVNADDGSPSGDESLPSSSSSSAHSMLSFSIKSDDKSSSNNGMTSSQSVPEYLATDENAIRKRSPKLAKKSKALRRSAPWYSVLQSSYKSRCEEFQKLFKGTPETERLTVDYSCAIQKEILVHGRMYVTQNYLCFYANIFKWETTLIIKLKDITAITKERTVRFIPNALQVTTATEKYFFTSFGSRDKSFMTIFKLWQNSLMDLSMPPTEFWKWIHNNYGNDLGIPDDELPEDYVYPSKEADDSGDDRSKGQVSEGRVSDVDDLSLSESKEDAVKEEEFEFEADENDSQSATLLPTLTPPRIDVSDYSEAEDEVLCGCSDQHNGKQYLNEVFGISCEKLFKLLFADDSAFYLDYSKARKSTDIVIGKWKTKDDSPQDTRTVTYTFPINSNIGPKTTQVTETQTFHRDLSKESSCYIATSKVENKGIPYSDNFHVLGRWCITRISENKCRLCIHADIEFIKSSWLIRNIIEKQVHMGLKNGYIFLGKYLRENLDSVSGKKRKGKRRRSPTVKDEDDEKTTPQRSFKKATSIHDKSTGLLSYILPVWLRGTQPTSRGTTFGICLVLFLLVIVNIFLYSQLQELERKSLDPNLWTRNEIFEKLDRVPASSEEWKKLIKQQQLFHEEELRKWRDIISLCVQLMKQMETALEELKADIDPISTLSKLDKYVSKALGDLPEPSNIKENDKEPT